ncbi:uncharacterized protein LOC125237854 isoform X2 [Leguminivora glycinivorella]|uniref:uncharacterized protein LOC125237854 isoform X2 n=1 Tax=Leguminivora glycinivorella TaxID=1035111 RepID=UPI00200D3249|nr:uncharacterized protein LOC125237854 isoform X2 [Leguminivora glycinivorella]
MECRQFKPRDRESEDLQRTFDNTKLRIQIRVGSDFVTKMGYLVNIDRLFIHPDFDRSTLTNNLVMLKVKKALRFQAKKVVAVKYDKFDNISVMKKIKDVLILGWGRRDPSEKEEMEDRPISRARLNIYDLEECKYIYTKEYVSESNFCAGFVDRGEGACNHDGGGPALAGSLLTGVISFGSPYCGRVDAPTVFTRLGMYADWIDRVLDSVSLASGKHENPHSFQIPGSIEVGIPSAEFDKMDLELENPREILQKEFGLKNILNGPIDKHANGTEPSKENEGVEIRKPESLRMPTTRDTFSEYEDPIEFSEESDDSEDSDAPATIIPENLKKHKRVKDTDEETDPFTNFMKKVFEKSNVRFEDPEPGVLESKEWYEFEIDETGPPTAAPARTKYYKEGSTTPHELTAIRILNRNRGKDVQTSRESLRSPRVFDLQYQIDIRPVSMLRASRMGQNKSVVILTNSGTTQRINVKNTNKLDMKLTNGIAELIEHINDVPLKKNGTLKKSFSFKSSF